MKNLILLLLILIAACSTAPQESDEVTEKLNKAADYAQYGNDYYNQGLYDKAIEFFTLSLSYNGTIDNQIGIASSYNSLGKVYLAKGKQEIAEQYFNEALIIATALNNSLILAQCSNNFAELMLTNKHFEGALNKFQEALSYAENDENNIVPDSDKAIILHNIGTAYKRMDQPDKALEYFERALALNVAGKRFEEAATNNYMIASLYSEKKEYTIAIEYINMAKNYLALGIIYTKAGMNEDAFFAYNKCLFVYQSLSLIYPSLSLELELESALEKIIPIAEMLGKHKEAEHFKLILYGKKE